MRGSRIQTSIRKKPLVLNLSNQEMLVLERLAERRGLTKSALLRQALRLYESIERRLDKGERLFLENLEKREKMELVLV